MKHYYSEYKKTGKKPKKEFTMLCEWATYLESLPKDNCPIKCEYARTIPEDVKTGNLVYEKGDIACIMYPGSSSVLPIEVPDICELKDLRITNKGLEGLCGGVKEFVKIDAPLSRAKLSN